MKEDFLTRFSEMGLQVMAGRITFQPWMLRQNEFLSSPTTFRFVDSEGQFRSLDLPEGTVAYTVCQVPVVAHRSGSPRIAITRRDGSTQVVESLTLERASSRSIFERSLEIQRLDVFLGLAG